VRLEEFEEDLRGNLYKIWNRMSSGSYFSPPVAAVETPKPHGQGTRMLGIPTVADRIAQTVVARRLEGKVEPIFHPDSYGYRPKRSALDAVGACRARCWKYDWVVDLDVAAFFDSVRWDLVVKAVEVHTDDPWVVLYVKRWLAAPARLIAEVRPARAARHIVFYAMDDKGLTEGEGRFGYFYGTIPLYLATNPQCILALEMNGAPLPVEHGAVALARGDPTRIQDGQMDHRHRNRR